ncbi:hypothetical protein POTOM_032709 [Populus tomentosa]|uniref:Sphingomyelin synthase-like domain-containing protein n=1 Tax=Populus tomentosa TaxID=118781 RepID=A0A8X8CQ99_POPTO|nr:hypothetical protein POTOM_032709 [Populus tomentosa]
MLCLPDSLHSHILFDSSTCSVSYAIRFPNFRTYGAALCIKQLAWLLAVVQTFLSLASCKHFTVHVFVSWYTVNSVAFFTDKKLPDLPERPAGLTSLPLLPQSRYEDSKNKEEHLPLLTGVSFENED